jgi:hypothetical protein
MPSDAEPAARSPAEFEMAIHRLKQYLAQKPNARFDARDRAALKVLLNSLNDCEPK